MAAYPEIFDHYRKNLPMHLLSRQRKMRFFLVENGLVDRSGHHYMEARSFRKVAKHHGIH